MPWLMNRIGVISDHVIAKFYSQIRQSSIVSKGVSQTDERFWAGLVLADHFLAPLEKQQEYFTVARTVTNVYIHVLGLGRTTRQPAHDAREQEEGKVFKTLLQAAEERLQGEQ